MAEDTLTMHRTFVEEIRQRRLAITEELKRLEIVERVHLDLISQLSNQCTNGGVMAVQPPENPPRDASLDGLTKHDACKIALQHLGGRQKTALVAEWLISRGYGNGMEKRVFYNACYTAMNRKEETFKRMKGGEWELIEKPSNP